MADSREESKTDIPKAYTVFYNSQNALLTKSGNSYYQLTLPRLTVHRALCLCRDSTQKSRRKSQNQQCGCPCQLSPVIGQKGQGHQPDLCCFGHIRVPACSLSHLMSGRRFCNEIKSCADKKATGKSPWNCAWQEYCLFTERSSNQPGVTQAFTSMHTVLHITSALKLNEKRIGILLLFFVSLLPEKRFLMRVYWWLKLSLV